MTLQKRIDDLERKAGTADTAPRARVIVYSDGEDRERKAAAARAEGARWVICLPENGRLDL